MQNIEEILKANGVELTEEQSTAIKKAVAENYKTVAEVEKKVGKLEAERDNYKEQLDTANETLKKFDGVDAEGMKKQIDEYEDKMKEQEEKFKQDLYDRDFSDVLKGAMEAYKFSSKAAEKSVMDEIKAAGLKLVDGKIIGLNDMVESIKERDASAFVSQQEEKKAKFTTPANNNQSGNQDITKDQIRLAMGLKPESGKEK